MRLGHARREEMRSINNVHGGAGPILFKSLFERDEFKTPFWFVHSAILLPGGGIGHHRHERCEEIFIAIDNESQFTHNGHTARVVGPAAVPLRKGESHAIYNHTTQETRWFNVNVVDIGETADATDFNDDRSNAPLESTDRLPIGRFDKDLLQYRQCHGGKGKVGLRSIWDPQDFQTNMGGLVHCVIPGRCSIGYHRHDTVEEVHVVMNGSGLAIVDGETQEVTAGDAVPNFLSVPHGFYNHTDEPLELFILWACLTKGAFDQVDLGDDLAR